MPAVRPVLVLAGKRWPILGISAWLLALAIAAALPVLIFASIAANRLATAERTATLADLENRTQVAANQVARYLQALRDLAVTLAASPALQKEDLQTFYDHAQRAIAAGSAARNVVVSDPAGYLLFSTSRPLGVASRLAGDTRGIAQTIASKQPQISNLFRGAFTSAYVFTVWAPVIRDGAVLYLVGVTVEATALQSILREELLREGWMAVVIDHSGIIVARTLDPEAAVGQPGDPQAATIQEKSNRGAYSLVSKEGVPLSAYFIKLPISNWTVAFGVSKRQLETPEKQSLRFMFALGVAALSAASVLSFLVGRRMRAQVAGVAQAAIAVGEGRQPSMAPSSVRELDKVANALIAARSLIDAREKALHQSQALLRTTTDNVSVGLLSLDNHRRCLFANPAFSRIFGATAAYDGTNLYDVLSNSDGPDIHDLMGRAYAGQRVSFELTRVVTDDPLGSPHHFSAVIEPQRDGNGEVAGVVMVIFDITERKRAEEHAAGLMKEVNHRAKNLLAVVQAVALHTAGESSPAEFAERFSQRLNGLAASHDLLVGSGWQGADAGDLIRSQLSHFRDLIGSRIVLAGPAVQLLPSAAQVIGMAIHELATNAAKYGALSNSAGRIDIAWDTPSDTVAQQFVLRWLETDGPPVSPPKTHGYGYMVIVEMAEYTLGAEISLEYLPTGVSWRLAAPARRACLAPETKLRPDVESLHL